MIMYLEGNLQGVAHVGVPVRDIKETAAWYERVLGFAQADEAALDSPEGKVLIKFLSAGNMLLELFQLPGHHGDEVKKRTHGLHDHFALFTDSVYAVAEQLDRIGLRVEEGPPNTGTDPISEGVMSLIVLSCNGERVKLVGRSDRHRIAGTLAQDWSHLCLVVRDLERSLRYYGSFGFQEKTAFKTRDGRRACRIDCKGFVIELLEDEKEAACRGRGRIDHVAFSVRNHERAYAELEAAGFRLLEEEPVFQPGVWRDGVYYFSTEGPDGEGIEFNHRVIDEG